MTLAVEVALYPNTTNQPTVLHYRSSFIRKLILYNTTHNFKNFEAYGFTKSLCKDGENKSWNDE